MNTQPDELFEDFDFMSLASGDLSADAAKAKPRETFPCGQCGGTGRYSGPRVHQAKSHCFACGGRGFFLKSYADRMKARNKAADRKAKNLADAREAFDTQYPGFSDALLADYRGQQLADRPNEFICSLAQQLTSRGSLSDKQVAAYYRGKEKLAAIKAERAAEAKAREVSGINLDPIRAMFDSAVGSGYKKPVYRAEGLKISLAPASGRNAGALYVVDIDSDLYFGKIEGTTFRPTRDGKDAGEKLLTIAADPKAAAIRYGQRTGTCSCCGRTLTNHASIDLGIGPICAEKWGF